LDRGTAESLLRGDRHHAAAPHALAHLLTAATAPARGYELVGEEAAVAAFRQFGRAPVHASGRRKLLTRLLTVKITAAFALTAVGGAALATAADLTKLPGTSGFGPRPAVPTAAPAPAPTPTPRSTGAPASSPRTPSAPPTPSARPSPENLCRILVADPRNKQAANEIQGLDSQALAALIALAGGKVAGVWSYCSRLLSPAGAASNGPRSTGVPGQPWDQYRNFTTGPYDWRSYYPQPPQDRGQNQNGQSGTQTADRDNSPRPGSRSARTSSLR
jgi:hypothetical protein